MNTVFTSIESLISDSDDFGLQLSAMEAVVSNRMGPTARKPLDKVMIHMGLESASSLCATISQEGVFSWIKEKLTALGRKINIVINKIYAKLTRADEATKATIAKAANDPNITLPISGVKATAVIAAATAVASAISAITVIAFSGKSSSVDVSKITKSVIEKLKSVKASSTKGFEKAKDKLKGISAKKYLNALRTCYDKIKVALGSFVSKFKSAEKGATSEAKTNDSNPAAKTSLWQRLKNVPSAISSLFGIVSAWMSSAMSGIKAKFSKEEK